MEFQEFVYFNKEKIAKVAIEAVLLLNGAMFFNHLVPAPEQTISYSNKDIHDTNQNSVLVETSSGTYIYSCLGSSLVRDKFGPVTAAGLKTVVTNRAPACANEWLTASDVPLIK